ncbi:hypothetical protein Cgig2_027439 [Carnegiea gigantea]|uniref:Uncharacterized protein n=1 Tax=Carnegiea gigantea TaxID=171969 RepID=A0A9Q1JWE5_9CARY|nr:hypothetical protein Cgig2_027439 [Carnegiea gigantea]
MKAWLEGKRDDSYARLPEHIEQLKKRTQIGLVLALKDIFLKSRRICCVHYNRNLTNDHPTCNACNKQTFKQAMEAIKKESKKANEWLYDKQEQLWARYKFGANTKCPDNTTNFVEFFNEKIEKFRPQSKRRRHITDKRKRFTKSSTLRCSICKQCGRISRSHR